jgi:rRNA maturation protein Rpf1
VLERERVIEGEGANETREEGEERREREPKRVVVCERERERERVSARLFGHVSARERERGGRSEGHAPCVLFDTI